MIHPPGARRLSSEMTFFYKFVFPVLWILLWAAILAALFIHASTVLLTAGEFAALIAVLLGATALFLWAYAPVVKVDLLDDAIRVSDFRRTAEIPLEDIESVSSSRLMNPELVWIRFRRVTEFGSKIRFIAAYRFFGGWNSPPAARKLKERLGQREGTPSR